MVRLSPILYVLGLILMALGVAMGATALFDRIVGEDQTAVFLLSSFITLFSGGALTFANRVPALEMDSRQAFVLTVLAWVGATAFGALPFAFMPEVSYAGAFFEAMSGLTTTGSTVLVGLDTMPRAILLWRSLLQWMGGIGIIVMAIAVLPFLRIGGMQLFKTESSDKSEKVMPRPGQIATATARVYLVLTALCAAGYALTGMSGFDAVNHAMTTLSTGGYSTYDASFGHFESPAAQWIGTLFMLAGGLPFILYVRMAQGHPTALVADGQVQVFLALVSAGSVAVALWLVTEASMDFFTALRLSAFNLASIITTTGYAAGDYSLWGSFPVMVVFLFTFMGACSGSTAGGIKIFRFQIIYMALRMQVQRMIHPHAVIPRQYTGVRLSDEVIASVLVFSMVYLLTMIGLALALAAVGLDFVTALTGAATAIGNVGPGLGEIIGPAGNFSSLPDAAIWILSLGMLLGRLELMTVFVLLSPVFWRS